MASEIQFKIFKSVYDEEIRRYSNLESKANLYLAIITAYLGLVGFKAADVIDFTSKAHVPLVFYIALGGALLLALLFTIAAMRIHQYEGICDLEEVIDSFGSKPPTDSEFLDDRMADLAVATNRNSQQNDRMASMLHWASILLSIAVFLQLVLFLFIAVKVGR